MNSEKSKFSTLIKSSLVIAPINEQSNQLYFCECDQNEQIKDSFDRIKIFFKKYPKFYYFLINYISPVYSNQRSLKKFLDSVDGIILNIGSGNSPRKNGILNIDIINYDNVDIVCDIHSLPF